jgi:hypothetical protein
MGAGNYCGGLHLQIPVQYSKEEAATRREPGVTDSRQNGRALKIGDDQPVIRAGGLALFLTEIPGVPWCVRDVPASSVENALSRLDEIKLSHCFGRRQCRAANNTSSDRKPKYCAAEGGSRRQCPFSPTCGGAADHIPEGMMKGDRDTTRFIAIVMNSRFTKAQTNKRS